MSECLKTYNIILLFILLSLYITSVISEIIYFISNSENNKNIFIISLIDSIITIIIIPVDIFLGLPSLLYLSKDKLFIFLIISFFFLLGKITISLISIIKEYFNFEFKLINVVLFIIFVELILLIVSFILCFIQRYQLIKEINEAPLNYVDEYITEDMYKIILKQSLNPEDKELKKDFQKKMELRKSEGSYSSLNSLPNSLHSSLKSKE